MKCTLKESLSNNTKVLLKTAELEIQWICLGMRS